VPDRLVGAGIGGPPAERVRQRPPRRLARHCADARPHRYRGRRDPHPGTRGEGLPAGPAQVRGVPAAVVTTSSWWRVPVSWRPRVLC